MTLAADDQRSQHRAAVPRRYPQHVAVDEVVQKAYRTFLTTLLPLVTPLLLPHQSWQEACRTTGPCSKGSPNNKLGK